MTRSVGAVAGMSKIGLQAARETDSTTSAWSRPPKLRLAP
jgi:hypothetical protein